MISTWPTLLWESNIISLFLWSRVELLVLRCPISMWYVISQTKLSYTCICVAMSIWLWSSLFYLSLKIYFSIILLSFRKSCFIFQLWPKVYKTDTRMYVILCNCSLLVYLLSTLSRVSMRLVCLTPCITLDPRQRKRK